jgi:predicted aspartyl protease
MKAQIGTRSIASAVVSFRNGKRGVKGSTRSKVLVDSGSQVTVIRADVLPGLEKRIGPLSKIRGTMVTANGEVDVTYLKDVKVCLDGACATVNVIAAPKLPGAMLVGTDFLRGADCKVDFKKGDMSCGGRKMKFAMEG